MSANKPKPQEIPQKPAPEEKEEEGFQKGGQKPIESGGVKPVTPTYPDKSGERKNP